LTMQMKMKNVKLCFVLMFIVMLFLPVSDGP
jgi:hypothetical protein